MPNVTTPASAIAEINLIINDLQSVSAAMSSVGDVSTAQQLTNDANMLQQAVAALASVASAPIVPVPVIHLPPGGVLKPTTPAPTAPPTPPAGTFPVAPVVVVAVGLAAVGAYFLMHKPSRRRGRR